MATQLQMMEEGRAAEDSARASRDVLAPFGGAEWVLGLLLNPNLVVVTAVTSVGKSQSPVESLEGITIF